MNSCSYNMTHALRYGEHTMCVDRDMVASIEKSKGGWAVFRYKHKGSDNLLRVVDEVVGLPFEQAVRELDWKR